MNRYGLIIEGLDKSRVNEDVSNSVKSAVKSLFTKVKAPQDVQKKINNILNMIYAACNEVGDNSFVGGKYEYTKGIVGSDGDGESGMIAPDVDPSIHSVQIEVRFNDRRNVSKAYDKIMDKLKTMSSNYEDTYEDGPGEIAYIVKRDGHASSFGVDVISSARCIMVYVYRCISPLAESNYLYTDTKRDEKKVYKTFLKNVDDIAKVFKTQKISVAVDAGYTVGGSGVYVYVYGFKNSMKDEYDFNDQYDKDKLKDYVIRLLPSSLKKYNSIYASTYWNAKISIGKKKIEAGPYVELYYKREDIEDDLDEEYMGTEVGLPIDKENCEGTDISSVSTPGGKIGEKKIICPKCKSTNVNIRDDKVYHCSDCDYEWSIDGKEISESMIGEATKFKVGKRYRTEDNMFFVIKKINKDGTVRVYDEDVEKEYDAEISDIELLNPVEVK